MLCSIAAMEPNQSPARLAAASEAVASFSPAPLRARIDGWTPEKQRLFCETLADCGLVRDAAAAVGMSPQSACALRRRAEGRAFGLAWNAALYLARHRLMDLAIARAIEGNVVSAGDQDEQNRKKADSVSKLSKVKAPTIAVSRRHNLSHMPAFRPPASAPERAKSCRKPPPSLIVAPAPSGSLMRGWAFLLGCIDQHSGGISQAPCRARATGVLSLTG